MMNIETSEHEFSTNDFYDELCVSNRLYQTINNGVIKNHINHTEIITLKNIERLVNRIISTDLPGYIKKTQLSKDGIESVSFHPTQLTVPLKIMNAYLSAIRSYEQVYVFSEHVSLFQQACNELELPENFFNDLHIYIDKLKKYQGDLYNDLVDLIRAKSKTKEFKKRVSNRNTNALRQHKSAHRYIDALFKKCSRLLVLRVDLSYLVTEDPKTGT
jgi:hypothetical protein